MDIAKEKRAIEYLRAFEPKTEPYYLCYSGGKDSDAIRILAGLAGVKHDIVHNLTTVDAPETVRYVKSIPNVQINRPACSMWRLIERKAMPPTRIVRYCCSELKEHGGKGRIKVTGVRRLESVGRAKNSNLIQVIGKPRTVERLADDLGVEIEKNPKGGIILNTDDDASRRFVEHCYRTTSTMVNPIVDWSNEDVWDFLRHYGCGSNPLYYEGFSRVGCVGCPMAGGCGQKREFNRWPKYKELYIHAFDRMIVKRRERGLPTVWNSGEECFTWWIGDDPNQITINDFDEEWYRV